MGSDGTLTINGTSAADTIRVEDGTNDDGTGDYYSMPGAPRLVVEVNGVVGLFDPKKVHTIHLEGSGGDDQINLSYSENLPATVNGGNGNDSITSGISALHRGSAAARRKRHDLCRLRQRCALRQRRQ